jgi:hypothetical protein
MLRNSKESFRSSFNKQDKVIMREAACLDEPQSFSWLKEESWTRRGDAQGRAC